MKKLIIILALTLTHAALLDGSAPTTAHAEDVDATAVVVLEIQGMVTPACPTLVKAAVGKLEGVRKVEASLETKRARIEYEPAKVSPKKIRAVIKDQVGFDSKKVG